MKTNDIFKVKWEFSTDRQHPLHFNGMHKQYVLYMSIYHISVLIDLLLMDWFCWSLIVQWSHEIHLFCTAYIPWRVSCFDDFGCIWVTPGSLWLVVCSTILSAGKIFNQRWESSGFHWNSGFLIVPEVILEICLNLLRKVVLCICTF